MMQTSLITFLSEHQQQLWYKLWQQLYLVGLSTAAAIIIGIPLGIWVTRSPRFKPSILGTAGILQTIPSLALLAFLLPLFGIGVKPALVALTLYALLPIIRNTLTGLEGVPENLLEAARGLGFTLKQRLWLVEMPLALPNIIAGIRTSAVIGVGIATLAAFIGAGGLGDFINQGLAMNNTRLILLGAVPAALLALVIDFGIGRVEKMIAKQRNSQQQRAFKRKVFLSLVIAALCLIVVIPYCSTREKGTVTVASKNFVESMILAEMMAEMIEQHTALNVKRKFNLGSTQINQAAMLRGEVDVYPEYTGTAYLIVLGRQYKTPYTSSQLYNLVKQAYQKQFNLTWLPPFGYDNSQALIVQQAFAKRHGLNTISDLVPIEQQLTLGAASEFMQRQDGMPGLKRVYDLHFKDIREMDLGLMFNALKEGRVQVIAGFSTDGRILAYGLRVLNDNKHLFPPYDAAPVIRQATLDKYPKIAQSLRPLAGLIDNRTIQALNYQVDVKQHSPQQVAHGFLLANKLIKK